MKSLCASFLTGLTALLAAGVNAQAQFTYTTNNGTITITGYMGPNDGVVIPSTIDGMPVTTVGTNAFFASTLTNVTIPNSVASIEEQAFSGCGLSRVTIPNSVTNIGPYGFGGCTHLTGVYFRGNAPSLSASVFLTTFPADPAFYDPATAY